MRRDNSSHPIKKMSYVIELEADLSDAVKDSISAFFSGFRESACGPPALGVGGAAYGRGRPSDGG